MTLTLVHVGITVMFRIVRVTFTTAVAKDRRFAIVLRAMAWTYTVIIVTGTRGVLGYLVVTVLAVLASRFSKLRHIEDTFQFVRTS